MRSVFGLVALDGGTATWDGAPITPTMRNRFGYMPEQRGLYPKMKAIDHVAWLGRLRGMSAAASEAAAHRWLGDLGLEGRSDERIERLSHGNQQRVQLAASLVHDPDLLVLDEPFSGLDPMGADSMAHVLRTRAREGATVLFSSHQLDVVADLCEDVAVIAAGKVVLEGTIEEVRRSAPRRRLEEPGVDPPARTAPIAAAAPPRCGGHRAGARAVDLRPGHRHHRGASRLGSGPCRRRDRLCDHRPAVPGHHHVRAMGTDGGPRGEVDQGGRTRRVFDQRAVAPRRQGHRDRRAGSGAVGHPDHARPGGGAGVRSVRDPGRDGSDDRMVAGVVRPRLCVLCRAQRSPPSPSPPASDSRECPPGRSPSASSS